MGLSSRQTRCNRPTTSPSARGGTPFPYIDAWVALPDGRVALIRHDPFRIDFASKPDSVDRGPPITYTPIAITPRERDAYRKSAAGVRMGASMVGGGLGPGRQGPQWPDELFPATFPPFIGAAVLATPEGQIWIGRSFSLAD